MKPLLHITTQQYHYYDVMPNGDIVRLDIENFKPSGQWKMTGISPIRGKHPIRGKYFIPFNQINQKLIDNTTLLYKNGKPKFTVRDNDHGTDRQWGDGIRSIYFHKD